MYSCGFFAARTTHKYLSSCQQNALVLSQFSIGSWPIRHSTDSQSTVCSQPTPRYSTGSQHTTNCRCSPAPTTFKRPYISHSAPCCGLQLSVKAPTVLPLHVKWGAQPSLPFVCKLQASRLTNTLSSCQSHSHWCVSSQCASAFLQAHLKSNGIC